MLREAAHLSKVADVGVAKARGGTLTNGGWRVACTGVKVSDLLLREGRQDSPGGGLQAALGGDRPGTVWPPLLENLDSRIVRLEASVA